MLYLKFLENNIYPILLKGKEIKDLNLEKVIKKAIRNQYNVDDTTFEKYMQLNSGKKALLIDDFQECELNSSTSKKLYDDIINKFGKVIIVIDSANSILPSMRAEFHDINFYTIKPLGYKKRNEIIEKYQYLKENPYTLNEQNFQENVKHLFDNVQAVLGDKLMPSYPIYVLSILQALEYKPLKQNETSFGYCYQTLLHYSLHKAGVTNDDMDSYFNFLSELAYEFIKNKKESISRRELNQFYLDYEKRFIVPPYDAVLKILNKSKIIQEDDEKFKFGYDYILFYLSAKKISDIIHVDEGKKIVKELFKEMHEERNANILVFITHHSKDISFIEDSLLNSMIVLDHVNPITLEKDDPFAKAIFEFAEEVKNDILEINRNPKIEREKILVEKDRHELQVENSSKELAVAEYQEAQNTTLPFRRSFRSIEIVGQIIKNRKGSLEKSQLIEMISELYTTGFRTIGQISNLMLLAKEDVIDLVNKETGDGNDAYEIEKRINRFIQATSFEACLGVFSKLLHSVGHKDLRNLYEEVAQKMNTPAAKLISFGITSYYGTIRPQELKKLADELKGNIVALQILRARVKSYVYNRNVDYDIKQKFASMLNMQLSAANPHADRQNAKR